MVCVVLGVAARPHRVDGLGELDLALGAAGRGQDAEPRQAVAAGVDDQVVGERVHAQQPGVGPVRDQRRPGPRVPRTGQRRGGQLEVLRAAVVVQDQQPVPGDLDVVLHALPPGRHDGELPVRRGGVQQPHLAGQLARRVDLHVPLVARQAHAQPEPLVRLLVHHHVLGRGGADAVPPHPVRPPRVVDRDVEQGGAVEGPGAAVVGVRDLVRQRPAARQVPDPQAEPLVAGEVGGVGEQRLVRAHRQRAHGEELVVRRQFVAVEENLLAVQRLAVLRHRRRDLAVEHPAAAVDAVLLALDGAHVAPPAALADRHRQVGLLGACLDLAEDRGPQVRQPAGHRRRVGVLRLQVGDGLRVLGVGEPGVRVDDRVAVVGALEGDLLR